MTLPTYIPLKDAAKKYGLSMRELRKLAESGKIAAATLPDGDVILNEIELKSPLKKEELPEYKKHAHLRGIPIWISQAARKYGVPQPTISKWTKKGYIKIIGHDGQKVLIDSADMAYCAEIYRTKQGRGKWLFNPDGTPYISKRG